MPAYWYAINSHPHKEEALCRQLQMQGIEVFYPCLRVNPVNPRARKIRAYFPGYLFVRADLEAQGLSTFQWMPYARGLVAFGGEPARVPEALIGAVRRRLGEIQAAGGEIFVDLHSGDAIIIQDGPFAGYEAIFDLKLAGSERVRVLLKMLSQREIPLELHAGQIARKQRLKR